MRWGKGSLRGGLLYLEAMLCWEACGKIKQRSSQLLTRKVDPIDLRSRGYYDTNLISAEPLEPNGLLVSKRRMIRSCEALMWMLRLAAAISCGLVQKTDCSLLITVELFL